MIVGSEYIYRGDGVDGDNNVVPLPLTQKR
jgi:hypothetical protein